MQHQLTDEFWEVLKFKYPHAFAHFSKWITQYKAEIGWDELFLQAGIAEEFKPVQFSSLPIDMQNGILARYDLECNGKKDDHLRFMLSLPTQITMLFKDLQQNIDENANNKTQTN